MIEAQTRALKPSAADNELTVQVYVTVALKWLIPRLHDFERRYPDMKVQAFDLLFRLGLRREAMSTSASSWPATSRPSIITGRCSARCLTPVCSPELLKGPNA